VDKALLKKATPALTAKAVQMAEELIKTKMDAVLKKLKAAADEAESGEATATVDLKIPVDFRDGVFGVSATLNCNPKTEPVSGSIKKVTINPDQPDLL